jgi:hypothetical protein
VANVITFGLDADGNGTAESTIVASTDIGTGETNIVQLTNVAFGADLATTATAGGIFVAAGTTAPTTGGGTTTPGTGGGTTTPTTGTATTQAVTGAATLDAAGSNVTFDVADGTFAVSISNFAAGDILDFRDVAGTATSATFNVLADADQTDGQQQFTVTDPTDASVVTVTLVGLTGVQDAGLFNQGSVDSVFGAGTLLL